MKKLAIIGASYLQRPLVEKAKEMGLETHVFAWKEGSVVDEITDYFYPISILEKQKILEVCKKIYIDGIISIASDLSMHTVNFIANKMNLQGTSSTAHIKLTDKYEMRKALHKANIPCPAFEAYSAPGYCDKGQFNFPVIVKPTDRSGSRGVIKIEEPSQVNNAIKYSLDNSFTKKVIIEEFLSGKEYSVEFITYKGVHSRLAITEKETTGAPYFVEIAHHQPAIINSQLSNKIFDITEKTLNELGFENGASHTEVLVAENNIYIIEIAGRMGGDLIGSDLVYLSTGFDFLKETINIALNVKPNLSFTNQNKFSGVYFLTPQSKWVKKFIHSNDNKIIKSGYIGNKKMEVKNSSDRQAYFVYQADKKLIIN